MIKSNRNMIYMEYKGYLKEGEKNMGLKRYIQLDIDKKFLMFLELPSSCHLQ